MKKFLSLIVAVLVAALAFVVTLPKRYLENAIKSQSMRIPSQSMGMKLLTQNYFTIPLIAPATTPATQYNSSMNSIIVSNGGSATFFPGQTAGGTATGGQYA